jgi:hypothetical protein
MDENVTVHHGSPVKSFYARPMTPREARNYTQRLIQYRVIQCRHSRIIICRANEATNGSGNGLGRARIVRDRLLIHTPMGGKHRTDCFSTRRAHSRLVLHHPAARRGREIIITHREMTIGQRRFSLSVAGGVAKNDPYTNDVYTCDLADETPTERMDHNTSVLTPAPLLLHLFPETTHQFLVGFHSFFGTFGPGRACFIIRGGRFIFQIYHRAFLFL